MNDRSDQEQHAPGAGFLLLERLTAFVLLLVLLALGWLIVVSWRPDWLRLNSEAAEVVILLALLGGALLLVSAAALIQTARGGHQPPGQLP